ncbi:MAG: sugar phosphate isomerase/epimerase [Myxococcales bacterium]|nr:sugar phosphate isomerase/epimerase [Myxococcales bacterium]
MPTRDSPRTATLCAAALLGARRKVTLPELREALAASAAAGFSAVSLWAVHHQTLVAGGLDPDVLVALLDEVGLSVPVVEAALGWANPDLDAVDAAVGPILEVAARYGAEQVLAVFMEPEAPEPAACVAGFARLCDLAAEHDLRVSLEFLPWSGIPDLRSAWQLVERCERDNAGLTLDTWHWQRQPGGPDFETLAGIPGARIHFLQLSDAPAQAEEDLVDETLRARRLPGEGDVDFAGLQKALNAIGARPLAAPEVFNAELLALGPAEMARRIATRTRAVWG